MDRRKYYYDENFFSIIDTEEKAYYLGFLYADGYVNEKIGLVELTLQYSDIDILINFLRIIKSNRKVNIINKKGIKYCRVIIRSKKIVSDLVKLGCINKKTHKLKFQENIMSQNLIRHMIRGFFDGDGCIWLSKRKSYYIQFDGNSDFICGIEQFFIDQLNIKKKKKYGKRHKDRIDNIITLKYGGNKLSYDVLSLLYVDATIYLIRKYKKFISLKNIQKNNEKNNEYLGIVYHKYNVSELYEIIIKETGLSRSVIRSRIANDWTVEDIIKYGVFNKTKKSISKFNQNNELVETYMSLSDAAKKNNLNSNMISINAKKNKIYMNHFWKFN